MPRRIIKSYELNQCALYKVTTKRKLAKILCLSTSQFKKLIEQGDKNYNIFTIHPVGRKSRTVEQPKKALEQLHLRIFKLLQCISPPDYLYSGVRKRSYVQNAQRHTGVHNVAKLDIKKYYPSTMKHHVFGFFKDTLLCSPDVAGILATLTTCNGHVPTGSPLSQHLAFYAHYNMFNKIHALSVAHGITMTCYVDDITFSGKRLSRSFLFKIKKIIYQRGLKYHKEHFYTKDIPKLITGVIIKGNNSYVPNKLNKGIGLGIRNIKTTTTDDMRSLVGKCNAATQIDKRFISYARHIRKLLK